MSIGLKVKNMKKRRGLKIKLFFRRVFRIRSWLDWDRVKGYTQYLGRGIKKFFVPQRAKTTQSFDEAVAKLNLSNADLEIREKNLLRLAIILLSLAGLILVYSVYHLFLANFVAFFLSLIVMCIALTLSFRYHFWYFQIKKRKLGCTIHEWFRQGIMGDKQ